MNETVGVIDPPSQWPSGKISGVPYWVFQREDVYAREQKQLFRGNCWNYLCLDSEIATVGNYVATHVGDTPVLVIRGRDGEIYAFENRCAHRGALLALKNRGQMKDITCVYHGWSYSFEGDLVGIAFKDGINGKGGMPQDFCMNEHGPKKLRVTTLHGLVFGSFSNDVPDIEEYLGKKVIPYIGRIMGKKTPVILGRFSQTLPNNWKHYIENTKDSYHASILHLFFNTFEINRMSQRGEIIVNDWGGAHVSISGTSGNGDVKAAYETEQLRADSDFGLKDPSMLKGMDEFGDGINIQVLSLFPGFALSQIQNVIHLRQILPRGPESMQLNWTILGFEEDTPEQRLMRMRQGNMVGAAGFVSMEDGCIGGFVQRGTAGSSDVDSLIEMGGREADSSESRVTESAIRGFWKAYRREMAL